MNYVLLIHWVNLQLQDEHTVTVAEESILFLHGGFVGLEHEVAPGEGGHHHQERRFRQVEVGEDGIDVFKVVGWVDVEPTATMRPPAFFAVLIVCAAVADTA